MKSSEQTQPTKVVPEKYDLKLPKDSPLTQADIDKLASLGKARGWSNEEAQEQLDERSNLLSGDRKAQSEAREKSFREAATVQWVKELHDDKEIGGEHFKENIEYAKRAVDKFGDAEFKQKLNETGFGNYPPLVRVFTRIGKMIAEDKFFTADSVRPAKKTAEQVLYDHPNSKNAKT